MKLTAEQILQSYRELFQSAEKSFILDDVLRAHAMILAEKIRAESDRIYEEAGKPQFTDQIAVLGDIFDGFAYAADLIDPEKNDE